MNASKPSFSINISFIEDELLTYDSAVRAEALSAIERVSQRVRAQMVYTCPESSFLQVDCEGGFEILFEAFSDHFDALDISFAETPLTERSGAFVVRRGDTIHALRITKHHDGVRPASATIHSRHTTQMEFKVDGGQGREEECNSSVLMNFFARAICLHVFSVCVRIPTKPAGHSDFKPATVPT